MITILRVSQYSFNIASRLLYRQLSFNDEHFWDFAHLANAGWDNNTRSRRLDGGRFPSMEVALAHTRSLAVSTIPEGGFPYWPLADGIMPNIQYLRLDFHEDGVWINLHWDRISLSPVRHLILRADTVDPTTALLSSSVQSNIPRTIRHITLLAMDFASPKFPDTPKGYTSYGKTGETLTLVFLPHDIISCPNMNHGDQSWGQRFDSVLTHLAACIVRFPSKLQVRIVGLEHGQGHSTGFLSETDLRAAYESVLTNMGHKGTVAEVEFKTFEDWMVGYPEGVMFDEEEGRELRERNIGNRK